MARTEEELTGGSILVRIDGDIFSVAGMEEEKDLGRLPAVHVTVARSGNDEVCLRITRMIGNKEIAEFYVNSDDLLRALKAVLP